MIQFAKQFFRLITGVSPLILLAITDLSILVIITKFVQLAKD
jgi:hypothetical protein